MSWFRHLIPSTSLPYSSPIHGSLNPKWFPAHSLWFWFLCNGFVLPKTPRVLLDFAASKERAGAPNTFLRFRCSLISSNSHASCHDSRYRWQERRIWRTIYEPLLHSHLSSCTSGTFPRSRNCGRLIFAEFNYTFSELNGLSTELCSRRKIVVAPGMSCKALVRSLDLSIPHSVRQARASYGLLSSAVQADSLAV